MGKGPKTKKSILKRFKITGTGKVMVKKISGRGHLLAHKSPKRKRQLKRQPVLGATATGRIKKMIGI
ncbi:MAG TPA: 50S ribosomal protein L35 [bacterium]|nr:50S ribosomal protein L35 [bacterium]